MATRAKWRKPLMAGLASLALTAGLLAAGTGTASATETPPPATTSVADADAGAGTSTDAGTGTGTNTVVAPKYDTSPDPTVAPDAHLTPLAKRVAVTSFDPDYIITDRNMYDGTALDANAVQAFLQQQVPVCQSGYTCLSGFSTTTPTIAGDARCATYTGRNSESAASIIARVGAACGVNQKALLVIMQKESELPGDDFPGQKQYDQAMGFDCSDSGPCNPDYAGFFKQVYYSAWQLQDYKLNPGDYQYKVGVAASIKYSPTASCNTPAPPQRTPATQATASLYNYTPYQPNAAALDGDDSDPCASFGNINFWVIYTDWFGYPQIDVDRVSGADRYSGAVEIAKRAFPDTAPVVFVANGQNYPDALSAGPAAVKLGGPLLLTDPAALPQSVADEISALKPTRIVVVGGVNSVSDAVKGQLAGLVSGVEVDRIAGASRYDTSRLLVQDAFPGGADGAFIATGANFPDALSAGAAAGSQGQPVLLVDGSASALDSGSVQVLKGLGVDSLTVVGGPNSVSAGVLASAKSQVTQSAVRISGTDRYDTSQKINASVFTEASQGFLATGANFPDALAGSAWAGHVDAPLYVVQPTCVPAAVRTGFRPAGIHQVTLLGGPNSLGDGVFRLQSC